MAPRKSSLLLIPACIALASVVWPSDAAAQRHVVAVGGYYGRPYYPYYARAYPYYYNPFFSFGFGFGYGYGAPFYPYGYGYPYPYGGYYYDPTPELRVQVTPRQAEVYIDGYLVGTVDDYDGTFQRLHVPFGEHQISIYREGYHTISEPMLFLPGQSYNIKQAMQPLGAGVAPEPRPAPDPNRRAPEPRGGSNDPRGSGGYPRVAPEGPGEDPGRGAESDPRDRDRNADRFGSVAIRVQPADAIVLIDGERWDTSTGDDRLQVQLSEGQHRVEIRKDGFKTYASTVRVRNGDRQTLNVSLSPGQ